MSKVSTAGIRIGDPGTLQYPQDAYGVVVVGKTPTTIKIRKLRSPSLEDGASQTGGTMPIVAHTYTAEQLRTMQEGSERTLRWSGGAWRPMARGPAVYFGKACYYRNYEY